MRAREMSKEERKLIVKLRKRTGTNGAGNPYDVRVVAKTDEAGILALPEQGFTKVDDLGAEKAVYRRKRK